jgi:MEDS: MEthanogen/methylotroph, DcmR Sensory domain
MNAKGVALLVDPHPCGHIVYPYREEGLVGQAVCLFASSGLRDGEGVVLIMSSEHRESFKLRLQLEGLQVEHYETSGQLTCVASEELVKKFVVGGSVDEEMFRSTIGDLINQAKAAKSGYPRRVRLFGEMVSQLRATDLGATTRLEELWDEVIKEHSVALLCTYALDSDEDLLPDQLITIHSHNIEREPAVP